MTYSQFHIYILSNIFLSHESLSLCCFLKSIMLVAIHQIVIDFSKSYIFAQVHISLQMLQGGGSHKRQLIFLNVLDVLQSIVSDWLDCSTICHTVMLSLCYLEVQSVKSEWLNCFVFSMFSVLIMLTLIFLTKFSRQV